MVLAMCVRVCLTDSLEGMNYKTYKDRNCESDFYLEVIMTIQTFALVIVTESKCGGFYDNL